MSIYQRPDRHDEWWIDLHLNGRRIRRKANVQTLEGAIEHERAIRIQFGRIEQKLEPLPLSAESTFAEFAPHWMTDYVAVANRASTRREKESALRSKLVPAFGHLKLSEISTNIVDAQVAAWMRSGMSIKRANNLVSTLRKAMRCAAEWGLLERAPFLRHHRYFPPIPQFLTRAESQRLLDSMEPGFWRTLVMLMLGTGARFGEAAALRWEDLDLYSERPTVTIRRGVAYGVIDEPKTKASRRTLVLIPELVVALRAHRQRRQDVEWVFTSPSGRFYSPSSTGKILKSACMKAGVPVITWHKLRHSCATQLLACGVPLPAIKEVLGHTSLEVTSIYTHVAPGLMWEYMQYLSKTSPKPASGPVSIFPATRRVSVLHGHALLN